MLLNGWLVPPLQSGLFNFFTKRLNKHALTSMLVCAGLTIAYRIPIRTMLDILGMPYYYSLVAAVIAVLTVSGCITIYKLYLSQKIIQVNNKTFFKCLFKNLINNPCLFIFKWLLFLIISYCIRIMVFYSLHMYEVELLTYLVIVFSTILPVLYTYHIVIQVINFIYKPITFAPFILKNGVVVYVPVYTHISLSIYNKYLHNSITVRNIILVLTFAVIGYYFKPLSDFLLSLFKFQWTRIYA